MNLAAYLLDLERRRPGAFVLLFVLAVDAAALAAVFLLNQFGAP